MYLILLFTLLALVGIIIIVWIAYSVSAAYQQTLSITIPFVETYRYVPNLSNDRRYKLDHIKVKVTGSIKKDNILGATITHGSMIENIVIDNIINTYKDCLLMHEANTFNIEETVLKRCPIVKSPTLENLSVMFFNKLAPLMSNIGCQLASVHITSNKTKVSHSRYKMSDYRI